MKSSAIITPTPDINENIKDMNKKIEALEKKVNHHSDQLRIVERVCEDNSKVQLSEQEVENLKNGILKDVRQREEIANEITIEQIKKEVQKFNEKHISGIVSSQTIHLKKHLDNHAEDEYNSLRHSLECKLNIEMKKIHEMMKQDKKQIEANFCKDYDEKISFFKNQMIQ